MKEQNKNSGQPLLLQKQVAFRDYIIKEFLIPPTSVCIDCDHRGNTETDFYSLLTNWVDDGVGILRRNLQLMQRRTDEDWEDPYVFLDGEPSTRRLLATTLSSRCYLTASLPQQRLPLSPTVWGQSQVPNSHLYSRTDVQPGGPIDPADLLAPPTGKSKANKSEHSVTVI